MTEFKVGDRVRLTGPNWGTSDVTIAPYIGEVVTIAGHNEAGNPVFRYYEEEADSYFEDLLEIDDPDWAGQKLVGIEAFADSVTRFAKTQPSSADIEEIATLGEETGISSFEQSVRRHTDRIANLLIEKNKQYSNSALDPIRVFSKADRTEQLRVRADDKLSRIRNGDTSEDALTDLAGYIILMKIAEESA